MKFDKDNPNPGTWFKIPGDEEEASLLLRVCTPEVYKEISKQCEKKRLPLYKGDRIYYPPPFVDNDLKNDLLLKYCIIDWKNIYDKDGVEIECNDENKNLLMNKSPEFAYHVTDFLDKINSQFMEKEDYQRKNSEASQKPSMKDLPAELVEN